jgi:hypothetical protein
MKGYESSSHGENEKAIFLRSIEEYDALAEIGNEKSW